MNTEYRKNLSQSLMITTLQNPELNYEIPMLKANPIKSLLPFELVSENGTWKVLTDITGRQSLDAWLDTSRMDSEFFEGLLRSINNVCRDFAPFLIDEDKLCLAPDHIFVKNGSKEFSFSFLPERTKEISDSFRELLEYLIARVDHHDEKLVQTAYAAYEKAEEDAFDIRELLPEKNAESPMHAASPTPAASTQKTEIYFEAEEEDEEFTWEVPVPQPKKSMLSGLFEFSKKKESKKEPEEEEQPFLPEGEDLPYEEMTTFLNPDEDYCKGILRYTGSNEEQDITIGETPFFIGTRGGVGGRLNSQAVSRLHAKITQAGEVYLIEDLNSTNGTFVNGKVVNYKSPVTLHPKDQVRFADEEFLFL